MRTNVYVPLSLEGTELCHPIQKDDFERINVTINGTSRKDTWAALKMEIVRRDEGKALTESDSPWLLASALIFRRDAVTALSLSDYGEVLPLKCADAELYMFNPPLIADALDEESSLIRRFSTGRIMVIDRYSFRPDAIRGVQAFKIPNLRVSPTYVGAEFLDRWRQAGLRGLQFKEVWTG